MKTYENYLFDLYGTLVDIHTDEEPPSFWRNVSRLLGMQGVHLSPAVLKAKYEAQIALQEDELRSRLPEGAQPEVNLAPVFRSFAWMKRWALSRPTPVVSARGRSPANCSEKRAMSFGRPAANTVRRPAGRVAWAALTLWRHGTAP